ncbi:MAG: glycoside hydrolase family 9 protein [Fibrobacter sp.]|nr:glycoside hydrolase family 9 protein [Fibrobacter sp.]
MRTKIFSLSTFTALATFGLAHAATFFHNQVGYDATQPKSVVVKAAAGLDGAAFTVESDGSAVYSGKLSKGTNPDNWISGSDVFYTADFSEVTTPGTYTIKLSDGSSLEKVVVAENALAANTLKSVMDYFYKDRADKDPIIGWDKKVSVYGSSGVTRDVHGGWYDASGDVSKYFSHLSYANYLNPQQIPLTVWALAFAAEKMPSTLTANPSTVTAIDEAIYGADFLVRMQDEDGFFYMTVFDNWGAGSRYLCAFSGSDGVKSADYKTAFREGGGMAIAALARASTLKKNGDYTSEQYLAAAIKGFDHLQAKQSIDGNCEYCDDGKENIIDDYTALLAATELYKATNESKYLYEAESRADQLISRLSEEGYFWSDDAKTRPFWHASDAGLPLVALVNFAEVEDKEGRNDCPDCMGCSCRNIMLDYAVNAIKKHLKWLVSVTNEIDNPFGYARQTAKTQGAIKNTFFIPHDNESNYWWQGEDARIASLSAAAIYAQKLLGELADSEIKNDVEKYATDQLDWILGKNPYGVCMMYGKGNKNPAIYDGTSNYDATLEGGIANGISGLKEDGSGIVWDDVAAIGKSEEPWNNWRWIEQWLPHSTWYLMALAARYDEITVGQKAPVSAIPNSSAITKFDVKLHGRILNVTLQNTNSATVQLMDLNGRKIMSQAISGKQAAMDLSALKSGVYMVKSDGLTKKIAVK